MAQVKDIEVLIGEFAASVGTRNAWRARKWLHEQGVYQQPEYGNVAEVICSAVANGNRPFVRDGEILIRLDCGLSYRMTPFVAKFAEYVSKI